MRWIIAVPLLAGCDALFQLDHIKLEADASTDGASRADSTNTVDAPMRCAGDSFNGSSIDQTFWKLATSSSLVNVTEANNYLEIDLAVDRSGVNENGVTSKSKFDLANADIEVELVEAPNQSTDTYANFQVSDGSILMQFTVLANHIYYTNGSVSSPSVIAGDNFTAPLFLRFHDASGAVEFWTSSDGSTWSTRATSTFSLTSTMLYATLLAGTANNIATPGRALFDNFVVLSHDCTL